HVADVPDQALLAPVGDDEPLDAFRNRHLGFFPGLVGARDLDVDEGPHALVLAEVAASVLAAMRDVGNVRNRVKADEAGLVAAVIKPPGFDSRADRTGLTAMLVDDDVGLQTLVLEARFDEVYLGLHRRQIVLRPTLQDERVP